MYSPNSPILNGCMDTCWGKAKFDNFRISLDIVCSPIIVIRSLMTKMKNKQYVFMILKTQVGNLTTNIKVKIYSTLLEFITAKNCYMVISCG